MSKGRRFTLAEGHVAAKRAFDVLTPLATRLEVAGSIRRGRPDVGDVDLVMQPMEGNPWVIAQIEAALAGLGYSIERSGNSILSARPLLEDIPGVDIYYANARTWGITLLIRTGSAAHNIRIAEHAQRACLPARALTLQGIVNTTKAVIASATEEECFKAIGLAYIDPGQREAPELEHRVKKEG